MYRSFYIKEKRYLELKKFIKNCLPSVRLKHNPMRLGDEIFVAMHIDVEDNNSLSKLFEKWEIEDSKPQTKSLWQYIKELFLGK